MPQNIATYRQGKWIIDRAGVKALFVWGFIFKPTLVSMYEYPSVSIYIFHSMVISFRSGLFLDFRL
jgi:hypothetical protein